MGESRNIKHLNKIVGVPDALTAFKDQKVSLAEALLQTNQPVEVLVESVDRALSNLRTAWEYLGKVHSPPLEIDEKLVDIIHITRDMRGVIQSRKNSLEDL